MEEILQEPQVLEKLSFFWAQNFTSFGWKTMIPFGFENHRPLIALTLSQDYLYLNIGQLKDICYLRDGINL